VTALPQSKVLIGAPGTNSRARNYRANAGACGASRHHKNKNEAVMRTLSLSLLYVLSMGIFIAAYGFVPFA
jgi:hypothetical protein